MAKKNTDLKLSLSKIKQKAKKSHEMEVHTFADETTLKFYPEFAPSKIESMIEEISEVLSAEGEGLEISEKRMFQYTLFQTVKHFTHLKNQFKATTLVGQINEMESLIDSGYFDLIINEVFPQSEIQKVLDQMNRIGMNVLLLENATKKMHDEVEKLELKNAELFKTLSKENPIVQ